MQGSELDFHIWNANWPMKCEAKMAAQGRQFCTSVLVSYAGADPEEGVRGIRPPFSAYVPVYIL